MTLFDLWNRILGGLNNPQPTGPTKPSTLPVELANDQLNRPIVFDPALLQFTAHRAGEPIFENESEGLVWYSSRMAVLHHLLVVVSQSKWQDHLLLRGSGVMVSWFGEQARRPGDLDWVVTPAKWKAQNKESQRLITELLGAIEGAVVRDEIIIPPKSHVIEDIWTYERAPGVRVVVPWQHSDPKYNGTIQMDFVFGEELPSNPVTTSVSFGGFAPISLQTASPQQSLAWKLLWLASDSYAMGKDLYDAVLLAERFGVSADVVRATFSVANSEFAGGRLELNRDVVLNWNTEWDEFIKEYPDIAGTSDEWLQRLADALDPLFHELKAEGTTLS